MNVKFGCAPINWSNDDLPSLGGELTYQQCLSEMALAGFKGSEGGIKYPKDFEVLKKALDLRDLIICNMWFSSMFTSFQNQETIDNFKKHMDFTYALGARVVGVGETGVTIHSDENKGIFSQAPILSDEQFDNLAKGLNELGKMAKEKGMKLCFHPHVGTGIETFEEVERLMNATDPNLVYLLYDTGHSTLADGDTMKVLTAFADRIGHVHVKDVRGNVLEWVKKENKSFLDGVKAGMFTVPGDGTEVPWDKVFPILEDVAYSGWIVVEAEQDPAKADPLEYAMKARKFLKEKTGL